MFKLDVWEDKLNACAAVVEHSTSWLLPAAQWLLSAARGCTRGRVCTFRCVALHLPSTAASGHSYWTLVMKISWLEAASPKTVSSPRTITRTCNIYEKVHYIHRG